MKVLAQGQPDLVLNKGDMNLVWLDGKGRGGLSMGAGGEDKGF